jgi:hypothetical protein
MGSKHPPGFYHEETLSAMKGAFRQVWETVVLSDPFRDTDKDELLRQLIIQNLMELTDDGITAPDELRSQTLHLLPLL